MLLTDPAAARRPLKAQRRRDRRPLLVSVAALAVTATAGLYACAAVTPSSGSAVRLAVTAALALVVLVLNLCGLASALRAADAEHNANKAALCRLNEAQDQAVQIQQSHDELVRAQALAQFGSWSFDPMGERIVCSPEALRLFGFNEGCPTRGDVLSRLHAEDRDRVAAWFDAALETGKRSECACRVVGTNGESRFVQFICDVKRSHSGAVESVFGTVQDVNERTLALEEQTKFSALIANSSDFIGMYNLDGVPFYLNAAGRAMIGLDPAESISELMLADYFTDENWHYVKSEVLPEVFSTDRWEGELTLKHFRSGATVITQASIFMVRRPETGAPVCLATVQSDVTGQKWLDGQLQQYLILIQEQNVALEMRRLELAQANAKLEAIATTDGLTDLKNHRAFQDRLVEEFKRARRYKPKLSVLMLDVDKFKSYNDTFGHPEGDRVLKTVANILLHRARDTDLVARYGGEEFVILLPNTDAQGALEAAERFRTAIEAYNWPLRQITVSIGAATLPEGESTAQELVDAADHALYASKERGRNCCTHADAMPDSEQTSQELSSIVHDDMQRIILALRSDPTLAAAGQIEDELLTAYDTTICSWSRLLDLKDKETEGHSERVTTLTERLARRIGMPERDVIHVRWGALLHDIGKMGVPDKILLKPGPLTEEEWAIMRRHTLIADEMLSPIPFLRPALDIPRSHHEKWDGTGYPLGLKGDDIPLSARLFAVVDVWDALRSDRPYRKGWSERKVSEYLRENAGSHFDPRAVDQFLQMLAEDGTDLKEAA